MIVDLDRKKLGETFDKTIDPNLLYEESDVDHDEGLTHQHHHVHNEITYE